MRKSIDLATAIQSVADQPASELTLAELVSAYSTAHCDGIDARLRKWTAAFGHDSAWAITSDQLAVAGEAMIEHGYAPSSANRDLSALGTVYRWAIRKRLSPRAFKSPTVGVRRFPENIRRVEITAAELEAVRSRALAFRDRRFGVFVALLVETGARKSELLERHWKDVDLERREILAPTTKNGTPRLLFFSDSTAELIMRTMPRRAPDRLVFEGRIQGAPVSFRKAWATLVTEIGRPDLHMHDMRHAAAANLLKAGVTLGVAAQVLGHDPAVLARRYGHLEAAALRAAQETAWHQSG